MEYKIEYLLMTDCIQYMKVDKYWNVRCELISVHPVYSFKLTLIHFIFKVI